MLRVEEWTVRVVHSARGVAEVGLWDGLLARAACLVGFRVGVGKAGGAEVPAGQGGASAGPGSVETSSSNILNA